MRLAYVALQYDYGKSEQGLSYETDNLEAGFREWNRKGVSIDYFHPDCPGEMSRLSSFVNDFDAIFHVAFNESIDLPLNIAQAMIKKGGKVIQWDCDSSWRFNNWILGRKYRVTDFITTHSSSMDWYKKYNMPVIRSQWGGSPIYKPDFEAEKKYDVSFIGQKHGIRPEIIKGLRNANIKVDLFGNYWDDWDDWHGYLPDAKEKVRTINQSKICLNLSNPHQTGTLSQIKGRHFEIPQCAAFQMSTPADDLSSYFQEDEEIVISRSIDELAKKIHYYLENEEKRSEIALAGYERMVKDHQWSDRFEEIFTSLGLL